MKAATLAGMPGQPLTESSSLRRPSLDRLTETLTELVNTALEEKLPPVVESLTNEVQQNIAKSQSYILAKFEEKMMAVSSTYGDRWGALVLDVVSRNEKILTQKIRELTEQTELFVKSRQDEFGKNLEGALQSGREQMNQQVEVASEASTKSRNRMLEASNRLEKQFAERCQELAGETQNGLSGRARQVEEDLTERFSEQRNRLLDGFSADLEKRFQQALAAQTASMEKRLEEARDALSNLAQQVAGELAGRLEQQTKAF
jgi:hypothetical protein